MARFAFRIAAWSSLFDSSSAVGSESRSEISR